MPYDPLRGQQEAAPELKGTTMIDRETAIQLHRDVQSSNLAWADADVLRNAPGTKPRIGSLLAHAIGGTDVLFIHAAVENPDGPESHVQVVAFTAQTVVVVTGNLLPEAVIVPRDALRALKFLQVPNLISNDWSAADTLRLELDYGSGLDEPIYLGHDLQTPRNVSDLTAFLPELQADLLR